MSILFFIGKNAIHASTTDWTLAFGSWTAWLNFNFLYIFHFSFFFALHAISNNFFVHNDDFNG